MLSTAGEPPTENLGLLERSPNVGSIGDHRFGLGRTVGPRVLLCNCKLTNMCESPFYPHLRHPHPPSSVIVPCHLLTRPLRYCGEISS